MRAGAGLVLAVLLSAGGASAEAPLTLGYPDADAPFWVDVRAAIAADGSFDPRFFGNPPYEAVFDEVTNAPGDRVAMGLWNVDYIDARICDDFDCAIRSAELIVRGTVVGRTYGFSGGEPGQVLEIAPDEVLKGEWRGSSLLTFYPVAEFCVGGKSLGKTDERWADPPDVGGEVFLFSGWKPQENGWLQIEYEEDIVPVTADGRLAFGVRSRMGGVEGPRTAKALAEAIRSVLETREQRLKHAAAPDGMPYLLYMQGNAAAAWVDARVAVGPDGRLDPTLFPPEMLRTAAGALRANPVSGGVVRVGEMDPDPGFFKPPPTLDGAARGAALAALARVTGRSFGFWRGIPGQLLRLAVERTFRGVPILDQAYLFLPQGDFDVESLRVVKTDSRFPDPLDIGGEVFLFTYPDIHTDVFFPLEGRGFVPVGSDGSLGLGPDYRLIEEGSDRPLRTKRDLTERILEGNGSSGEPDSLSR